MSEIVGEAWRKYMLQLQLHPLRTKAVTAGVLIGFSDAIAQKISGIKKLQFRRLLLLMLYGFVYSGPFGHFLHKMMDIIFKGKKGNKTIAKKFGLPLSWYCFTSGSLAEKIGIQIPNTVLAPPMNFVEYLLITMILWMGLGAVVLLQVLLEQLTSSPWNNMLFMIYYGLVVEGRPWGLVKNKVRKDYPSIQLTAWKFWPIVGWVNYQYMPVQFRVVFHSFVASCWGIFLNLKARSVTIKKA